jgi:superoxide dismutase, Fe-Mn family
MAETTEYFSLPELPYATNALEPYIDDQTMQIHHGRHHKAYVDNLNKALAEKGVEKGISIEDILKDIKSYSVAVRNNAGGHYNHTMFWSILSSNSCGGDPTPELMVEIDKAFGTLEGFKTKFEEAAIKRFGSGWAWLVMTEKGLAIGSTPNQDCPLMPDAEIKGYPIIGLDVWEHAYYLKYQNKRPEYVSNFWNILDWGQVDARFNKAASMMGSSQHR